MSLPKDWEKMTPVNPSRDIPTNNKYRDGSWVEVPEPPKKKIVKKKVKK